MAEQDRYLNTKIHTDTSVSPNIKRYGPFIPIDIDMTTYSVTTMKERYNKRLDKLAYETLGDSKFWWVIAYVNGIKDPFNIPNGTELRIPTPTALRNALNPEILPVK